MCILGTVGMSRGVFRDKIGDSGGFPKSSGGSGVNGAPSSWIGNVQFGST